ncbi:SDR family NAD(P)-dependent oxidoreductase [Tahibacter sp.]|uniref:SDR family NAD(P)-dependent oxidoreductase n=1 Tax=Tahibacter sp. TaxID=2056211 RepID=UPI0028C4A905|nr:SDR family NAD(P)-dependent oxidoreductase [Tahibacter sp.]
MTTHETSARADLIERARLQNAVLSATADGTNDVERLVAALAQAVPALIAWSGRDGTLRYADLPAASQTACGFAPLHLTRQRLERTLPRARALLALIGVRPGRRIGVAPAASSLSDVAVALSLLSAGCFVEDAAQADVQLCMALDAVASQNQIVLMFGASGRHAPADGDTRTLWFIEECDADAIDLFAVQQRGNDPAVTAYRELQPCTVVDSVGNAVTAGTAGWIATGAGSLPIRARRLPDGRITIAARHGGIACIDGVRVDLTALQRSLALAAFVHELQVVARPDEEGNSRVCVFYAVGEGVDMAAALSAMMQCGEAIGLKLSLVPLPRLPRDAAGDLDLDRLMSCPVLDDDELAQAGSLLRHRAGVDTVTLSVRPAPASSRPVMLAPPPSVAPSGVGPPDLDAAPSLVDGGELVVPDSVPLDLRALLQRAARQAPERGLLCIGTIGNIELSYAALHAHACRDAAWLREAGVLAGDRVIVHRREPLDIIQAFWACVYARAVPCMGAAQQDLADAAEHARVAGLVQRLDARAVLTIASPRNPIRIDAAVVVDLMHDAHATPTSLSDIEGPVDADAIALVMLTSGSTRLPKLVPQTHRALISHGHASGSGLGLSPSDVSLNWMPLDHVGALVMFHLRDMQLTCRQVHVAKEYILSEPLRWLDLVQQHRVSVSWAPNFAFALLNARLASCADRHWDLSSLRFVINAGEAVMPEVAERLLALCAPFGMAADAIKPAWGMSETCSLTVIDRNVRAGGFRGSATAPVGALIPGLRARIVDGDDIPVPFGRAGALQVRGIYVLRGYLGEATNESFTADGWFRTGDLARWDSRGLSIVGRDKDVVIVNGRNISCQAVEHAVGEVDGIESAQTTVTTYRPPGAVSDQVAVFVVPTGAMATDTAFRCVRERVRDALQIDVLVVPVRAQDIPRTQIGKAQRGLLQKRLADGQFAAEIAYANSGQSGIRALPAWFFAPHWVVQTGRPALPVAPRHWRVYAGSAALAERACLWLAARGDVGWTARGAGSSDAVESSDVMDASQAGALVILPEATDAGIAADHHVLSVLRQLGPDSNAALLVTSHGLWRAADAGVESASICGALAGMLRSVRQERPQASTCWVDAEPDTGLERQLTMVFDEWSSRADEPVVRFRAGRREVQRLAAETFATTDAASPLRDGGRYVVTGAAGALGRLVCQWLQSEWNACVVGVGRSIPAAWPASDQCQFVVADVADAAGFRTALAAVATDRTPIDGVFHLAGEFESAALAEVDDRSYQQLTRAKREGTVQLAQWLRSHGREDRRSALILFGSVNSHFGATGAAAYAAACAAQSCIADCLAGDPRLDVRYLGWSQWKDLGLSRRNALSALSAHRGFLAMDAEVALHALHRALSSSRASLLIGLDGAHLRVLRNLVGPLHDPQVSAEVTTAQPQDAMPPVLRSDRFGNRYAVAVEFVQAIATDVNGPQQAVYQQMLQEIWQDVIGMPLQDLNRNFFESGGSSLRLMQVKSRLEERCGRVLEVVDLFRFPTVRALAAHLAALDAPPRTVAGAVVPDAARDRAAQRRQSRVQGRGGRA